MKPGPALLACVLTCAAPIAARAADLAVPFDFFNNQIFVKAQVNGHAPVWLIVDSGASGCVVDPAFARRWGLKVEGQTQGTGAGKGTVTIRFAPDVTYGLAGGLKLTPPRSYVIDLSGQTTLQGREVAGILGRDLFARYVVDIDFETRVMTLRDPQAYAYEGPGAVLPITLSHGTPHVRMSVKVAGRDPVEQEVLVDSGSGDATDLDELANSPARLEVVGGVGLGQEFRTTLGRGEWARIGPYELKAPQGVTGGVPLIGNEVLRRFRVIFDYPHARMVLEPNGHIGDPFAFDASGLDLRWTADLKRFAVHDLAKGSPAAAAGLKAGEEIAAIDGQPASAFDIAQMQKLLAEPGRRLRLTVQGKAGTREVELALKSRL